VPWIIAAVLTTCVVAFLTIQFPAQVALATAFAAAAVWLWKQGAWRASYVLVIVSTLGAISSVPVWADFATYGRVGTVALLLAASYITTSRQRPAKLSRLEKWVLGLLGLLAFMAAVSIVWSAARFDTAVQAALMVAFVLILHRLVTRRWVGRSVVVKDLRAAIIVLSMMMAIGIAAFYAGALPATFSGRFQGLFNNPNVAALIAVITLFIAWGLFLERRTLGRFLILLPPLLTIALTQSRTAFLAVVVGAAWIALRSGVRVFVATAALGGAAAWLGSPLWLPVVSRFGVEASGDVYAGRTLGWQTALTLLQERPIGYGWGATQAVFASAYESGQSTFRPQSIHNSYLQVAFELNWLGFALMALLLVGVIGTLLKRKPWGIEVGLSGSVVAGLGMHFSESAMFGTGQPYPWLFWFAVAGLLVMLRVPRQDRKHSQGIEQSVLLARG